LEYFRHGKKGWKEAQVTAGGVDLAEINRDTMESLYVPNLYFTGELLDVDEKWGIQPAMGMVFRSGGRQVAAMKIREEQCLEYMR
jgi:predicted flavoprotein YhiN